ncbi:MAG: class II glutamine amidotransferase [Hydrogenophaga sp.]|nr:class II glutamine amidotransferase [Polaromonas sp.]MDP2450002.1 class II glutamine amidotransferase [Polaromonas sp.]MDP3166047.1 class II glutamine amidotransferase [Hydrogenophaga sp.]MDP3924213.1 class II glutamine amidotransferase [Hydrogenophaga sp.]
MRGLWGRTTTPPSVQGRLGVVAEFVADFRQLGPANFLYADGEVLFAHGDRRTQRASGRIAPPGLFRLSQQCSMADQSLHTQGVSVVPGFQAVTLIASVPLSAAHWQPFVEGEIVAVSAGMVTTQGI